MSVANTDRSYYVIFNERSGTAEAIGLTADALEAHFTAAGLDAVVDARGDVSMEQRAADALASPAQVIVAAGGDGTVTALAETLAGTDKSLAILPLGTVNALAKDLHIPLDIPQAIAALAEGEERLIDVGEVNGRIFLHKVVVGVIPAVAAGRERIRGRHDVGAKLAFLRYFARRLTRARRMALAITTSTGKSRIERVQAVAVACNAYDEGVGQFFTRSSLNQGRLTLYTLRHLNVGDVLRLTAEMFLGTWRDDEALSIESADAVTIDSHKSLLKVMFDGEVETLRTPLEFSIRKQALSIIVQGASVVREVA
ncbi:MAG TPA: diacylglycerol kinase family protein [Devosia sp.]|jgi:diacylglycerol kinase family enzyme|nr:diacylglycerol kinase family protein [Devosia sp.]